MRLLVLALPVIVVAVVLAILRRVVITVGVNEQAAVVQVARRTRFARIVGLLLGLVAAGGILAFGQRVDALGRLTALAPAVLGAGVLLGTLVGELSARGSVGVTRTAVVENRRVRDVLPRGMTRLLAVGSALLVGALGAGAAWGSPDDLGRAGRSFAVQCTQIVDGYGPTVVGHSHGPFPGSYYALPLALALVVLALLVALALRSVVRRPRPGLDGLGLDTTLRRWSVSSVVAGATVTVLGTLAPVALFLASGLDGVGCGLTLLQTVVKVLASIVAPLAAGGAAGTLAALLVTPRIQVDDLPRGLPGGAAPVGTPVR